MKYMAMLAVYVTMVYLSIPAKSSASFVPMHACPAHKAAHIEACLVAMREGRSNTS